MTGIFQFKAHLHLTVDHSGVLAVSIDVMDLSQIILLPGKSGSVNSSLSWNWSLPQHGMKNMIHVDGKNVEEAARSSSVDGVASVVSISPRVGSVNGLDISPGA